jgi:hypothetical protein
MHYILFVYSIIILRAKLKYKTIFFYGFIINYAINTILKYIFFAPCPHLDNEKFYIRLQYECNNNKFCILPDTLDFPSGHLQSLFYIVFFMYNFPLTMFDYLVYTSFVFISIYDIFTNNYHTIQSMIVGAVLGSVMGNATYQVAKKMIT